MRRKGENAMKGTPTRFPQHTAPLPISRLIEGDTFAERMGQMSAAIAHRAYELFEARGSEHGHDLQDWFRAESELLAPLPATIIDTDGALTVRAELRGLIGKDVEVLAEPKHLIVRPGSQTSEQDNGRAVFQGKISGEVFQALELPCEVDPHNMKATIENEVVEVTLAKVNPGKKNAVWTKAA
jgi:HSP20 family protein